MKKKMGLLALVAGLVLAAGLVFGCDSGGGGGGNGSNPFIGTWTGTFSSESVTMVIAATTWESTSLLTGGTVSKAKGTYTYSGNTAQGTTTHETDSTGAYVSAGDFKWTATVSGNTLTAPDGRTLTKQ